MRSLVNPCRHEEPILFSSSVHKVQKTMKSIPKAGLTIKNFADEVPESNSMPFAAALCNAGLKA